MREQIHSFNLLLYRRVCVCVHMSVPKYATQSRYVQVPICSRVPVQWMCLLWLLNWKWSGLALTSWLFGEQHAAQCFKSGKRMLFYWLTEKCQSTMRKLTESSTVSDGGFISCWAAWAVLQIVAPPVLCAGSPAQRRNNIRFETEASSANSICEGKVQANDMERAAGLQVQV